jgi:HK97 gp10 family phage protein
MISLTGLKEIDKVLRGIPDQLQDRVLKNAHADAAKPLISAAKSIVHVKTGNLQKSIGVVRTSLKKTGQVGLVQVGPRRGGGNKGFHGHLIEYGKTNKDETRSKKFPFMEPAFNQTQRQVESNIAESLGKRINQFMKRTIKNG